MTVTRDSLPHLHPSLAIGPALREVVRACCELPAKNSSNQPDAAVHRARQALKRARAVLRLGESFGVPRAKITRRRLARHGRKLSPLRDATVAVKVAEKLVARADETLMSGLAPLASKPKLRRVAWWALWKRQLAVEARRACGLDWEKTSLRRLVRALQQSAKQVCQGAERVNDIATAHEWRKAVIVLREQIAVVRPLLGSEGDAFEYLRELSRRLGRALDIQVLCVAAKRRRWPVAESKARHELNILLREKRKRALAKARKLWPEVRCVLEREFD
jgi:hypothetical protein